MKVLVTGGAGFIGSHVVDAYLERGDTVVIVDDLSTGREVNLNAQAKLVKMDIRLPALEAVFAEHKPEIVNHHAAQIDVRHSVADPVRDAEINVLGSINLLECARRHGVRRVVYASSGGAVYGEPVSLPCTEDHPAHPICPYGASKYAVEHYLFLYAQLYGLDYAILRYANVYGPRQDPLGEAGVAAIFTAQMLAGDEIVIFGDGEQSRDFVYVGDIARANLLATDYPASGLWNIGTGVGTSINRLFALLRQATGYGREGRHGPDRPGETRHIYLDASRAAAELGWSPSVDLAEGLRRTVEGLRQEAGSRA